jgi:pectin methylesterase-like acyl-CoA thioesterase
MRRAGRTADFWQHSPPILEIAMNAPFRLVCLIAFGLALAACASKPASEMPAATTAAPDSAAKPAAAAEESDEPPMERAEANAQCWMKYDKSGGSLEAKAKLVDKCAAEKMKRR